MKDDHALFEDHVRGYRHWVRPGHLNMRPGSGTDDAQASQRPHVERGELCGLDQRARVPGDEQVRRDQAIVVVDRDGGHAEKRRQPGQAAAGAEEVPGACDQGDLQAQVVARSHARADADHARRCRSNRSRGARRAPRRSRAAPPARHARREPTSARTAATDCSEVESAGPAYSLAAMKSSGRPGMGGWDRPVVARGGRGATARPSAGCRTRRCGTGRTAATDAAVGPAAAPDRAPGRAATARCRRRRPRLLLPAALVRGAPLGVAGGQLLRRRQVEEVHVAAGERAIQLVEAAARHDDQPLARHAVRVLEPAQERNPVQDLVADFRQPRPDHDRPAARRHLRDPRARWPGPRRGTPGAPARGRCGARSAPAACAPTASAWRP